MEGLDVPREGIDSVSHRQVFREEIRNAIREAIFSWKLNPGANCRHLLTASGQATPLP